jgi:hypothetical protein
MTEPTVAKTAYDSNPTTTIPRLPIARKQIMIPMVCRRYSFWFLYHIPIRRQ